MEFTIYELLIFFMFAGFFAFFAILMGTMMYRTARYLSKPNKPQLKLVKNRDSNDNRE